MISADRIADAQFGTSAQNLMQSVHADLDELVGSFNIRPNSLTPVSQVLIDANRRLAELLVQESTARARSEEQLQHAHSQMVKDESTDTLNRDAFDAGALEFLQGCDAAAMLLIQANAATENCESSARDEQLKSVAALVKGELRTTDLVARFSEELLVVLLAVEEPSMAVPVAERLSRIINAGNATEFLIAGASFDTGTVDQESLESLQQLTWFRMDYARRNQKPVDVQVVNRQVAAAVSG